MDEWAMACGVQKAGGFQLTSEEGPLGLDVSVMTTEDMAEGTPVLFVSNEMILASDQMVRAARPGADRRDADAATETRELPAGSAPRQVLDLAPLWFKVARGLLAHASLVFAVYLLFTGCFNLRLVDVTE